jgi:hypothetical protein
MKERVIRRSRALPVQGVAGCEWKGAPEVADNGTTGGRARGSAKDEADGLDVAEVRLWKSGTVARRLSSIYLGMQLEGVRSTSQVAKSFMGTGRLAGAEVLVRSAIFRLLSPLAGPGSGTQRLRRLRPSGGLGSAATSPSSLIPRVDDEPPLLLPLTCIALPCPEAAVLTLAHAARASSPLPSADADADADVNAVLQSRGDARLTTSRQPRA